MDRCFGDNDRRRRKSSVSSSSSWRCLRRTTTTTATACVTDPIALTAATATAMVTVMTTVMLRRTARTGAERCKHDTTWKADPWLASTLTLVVVIVLLLAPAATDTNWWCLIWNEIRVVRRWRCQWFQFLWRCQCNGASDTHTDCCCHFVPKHAYLNLWRKTRILWWFLEKNSACSTFDTIDPLVPPFCIDRVNSHFPLTDSTISSESKWILR